MRVLLNLAKRLNDWIEQTAVDAINDGDADREMFDVVREARRVRGELRETEKKGRVG